MRYCRLVLAMHLDIYFLCTNVSLLVMITMIETIIRMHTYQGWHNQLLLCSRYTNYKNSFTLILTHDLHMA